WTGGGVKELAFAIAPSARTTPAALPPALGVLGQGLPEEGHEGRRQGGGALAVEGGRLVHVLERRGQRGVAAERDVAGEQLEDDDPQRVDVGARIGPLSAGLLRTQILRRAQDLAGGGDVALPLLGDAEVHEA